MNLLLRLIIAHIITDFFIQPNHWVTDKRDKKAKSKYLYFHILITGVVAWIALWDLKLWYVAVFIATTHYLIDLIKLYWLKDNLVGFILDQLYHLAILVLCSLYITKDIIFLESIIANIGSNETLLIITGYMLVSYPVGYMIGKATKKWQQELTTNNTERDSLRDAGIWIGILERTLVLTFVLFGQFQAIGFLIAAKSILRFSDKNGNNPSKQTEYVLIGTLLSFTIALFIGILVKNLIS